LTTDGASDVVEEATLNPPGTITGRVSFSAPSDDPVFPGIRMRLVGDASLPPAMRRFVTVPFADGTFEVIDLPPGRYVVETESSTEFDAGLALAHAALDGRDVTDLPIDLSAGQELGGLDLVLTESLPSLEGRHEDDDPNRIRRATVVILPADASRRYPGSRRIRTVRPDTTGRFAVALPAGSYLIALVDEPMPETIRDMRFLEELVPLATPVTVLPDATTTVVVRGR